MPVCPGRVTVRVCPALLFRVTALCGKLMGSKLICIEPLIHLLQEITFLRPHSMQNKIGDGNTFNMVRKAKARLFA